MYKKAKPKPTSATMFIVKRKLSSVSWYVYALIRGPKNYPKAYDELSKPLSMLLVLPVPAKLGYASCTAAIISVIFGMNMKLSMKPEIARPMHMTTSDYSV